jgi:hypothetical protein
LSGDKHKTQALVCGFKYAVKTLQILAHLGMKLGIIQRNHQRLVVLVNEDDHALVGRGMCPLYQLIETRRRGGVLVIASPLLFVAPKVRVKAASRSDSA